MESDCAECGFNADRIHTMEKRRKEITIHTRNDSAPARNSVDSFRRLRGERERESQLCIGLVSASTQQIAKQMKMTKYTNVPHVFKVGFGNYLRQIDNDSQCYR